MICECRHLSCSIVSNTSQEGATGHHAITQALRDIRSKYALQEVRRGYSALDVDQRAEQCGRQQLFLKMPHCIYQLLQFYSVFEDEANDFCSCDDGRCRCLARRVSSAALRWALRESLRVMSCNCYIFSKCKHKYDAFWYASCIVPLPSLPK
jgi:hypothetical protein